MSATYFWSKKRRKLVVIESRLTTTDAKELGVLQLPCVDTNHDTPDMRYGKFNGCNGWDSMPVEHLPPEFRATLLLLGVS